MAVAILHFSFMAIAKISNWLNDLRRDYNLGVLLYEHYGKSVLLKTFFKNGNSQYHQDRLYASLEELNGILEDVTNTSSFKFPKLEEIAVPIKRYGVTDEVWNKLPDQIKDLYTLNSKLHRHSQMLFDQARIAKTDEERIDYGMQILSERKKLNSNWEAIKDYFAQGKIKEKIKEEILPSVDDLSMVDLVSKSKNIPTYLSKDRSKLNSMQDGPKKNKVLLRIQDNEIFLAAIKKRLEGIQ